MFAIIGIIVVFGAVVGGYLMEKGILMVLVQPAELVIIGGAALGTILVANPLTVLKGIVSGMVGVLKGSRYTKALYLDGLKMFFELFQAARRNGIAHLESQIDEPEKSPIFTKYKAFLADHHALRFVCDTLRMASTGGTTPFDLDQMMEADLEVHHKVQNQPVAALSTMADSLPGLGIVAAVLGVVITMGALVGTFLGILMCYGLFGPIASNMSKINEEEGYYYNCLRQGIVAFLKGSTPIMAVEFARRVIPEHLRPTFQDMEKECKQAAKAAQTTAAAAQGS
jgi:chemotaxis protein MotA